MDFCNNCNNMYYIKLSDEDSNSIIYYCRNCGNIDNNLLKNKKCILKEDVNKNINKFDKIINKYTKYDPTLPRINYIKCPNDTCSSNVDNFDILSREIIYIRYDSINMKYIYLCSHCDYIWNIEKK